MYLQARCNIHHPGFRKVMLKIYVSSMLMSCSLKIHKSAFFFFLLFFQFERACSGMLYFAATEVQELPLSTSLSILKSNSHFQKKIFICFNDSPSKMMKNAFYFILKVLFVLKMFKIFVLTFWGCSKNGLIRKIRLISKFLT